MNKSGEGFVLYDGAAYPVSAVVAAPFRLRIASLPEDQQQFNKDKSCSQICVEWAFAKIVQYFAFVDFTKIQKVLLKPLGKYYAAAALLTNCHTTL